jgi:hypothetical protein
MEKTKGRLILASIALMGVVLAASPAFAQQTHTGGLTGLVEDPSGARIPQAEVVAEDAATNRRQSTITTSDGLFSMEYLPVGSYQLTVTKEGFQKSTKSEVHVIAGQDTAVNFTLVIGSTSQTVNVVAAATVVNPTDTNQGTTRTLQEIQDLPINLEGNAARAAVSTVQTLSGVNYNVQQSGGQSWTIISRAQINGVEAGGAGYEIDGLEASPGESENGEDFIAPTPDQVQEVRITDNTDASQGFNGGVSIALTTKSGTNNVHGDVYYYNRNDALEARNFFLPKVSEDKQNEPGFQIGGPVYIPHVYDGRNKTFFYGGLDIYRFVTGASTSSTVVTTVPTAASRAGDFTELLGAQNGTDLLGRPVYAGEIYDPLTTRQVTAGQVDPVTGLLAANSGTIRDPFAFGGHLNVIDPTRLSSVSQSFQQGFANPNNGAGITNNWVGFPNKGTTQKDQWNLKIDQLIGDKHRLSFSVEKQFAFLLPAGTGDTGHSQVNGGSGFLAPSITDSFIDDRGEYRYRFNYVWTVKPDLLLSFRAGITRDPNRNIYPLPKGPPASTAGCDAGLTGTLDCRTPRVSIENVNSFGPIFNGYHIGSQRTPFILDLAWTKGKHQFEFGANYITAPFVYAQYPTTSGSFSFSHLETALPNVGGTGWGYASFVLGAANTGSVTSPVDGRWATSEGALYAQDKFRVNQKLTLNYGLRWELTRPPHELQNKISSFDPSIPNPGAGNRLGAVSVYGTGPGRNGLTEIGDYYFKAFAPKLGIAYAWNPKTVLRASAGISYYAYWQKWLSSTGPYTPADGFNQTLSIVSTDNGVTPAFYWDQGFPGKFPQFPVLNPSLDNNSGISYIDRRDNRPPMVENFGAEVERQLAGHVALRVGYVGTFAHRLYGSYNLDSLPLQYLSLGSLLTQNINTANSTLASQGLATIPLPYPGYNDTVARALTPYPQYTSVTNLSAQLANTSYNSLQVNVQRHFGDLTFLANLTIAKMMSEADLPGFGAQYAGLKAQSFYVSSTAKSLAGNGNGGGAGDVPKQANISWYWNVPVGHGKRWLTNASTLEDRILGNWRLSGIQAYQSGMPFAVSSNASIPSVGAVWPVLVPGVPIKAVSGCGGVHPGVPGSGAYLNTAAFQDPSGPTSANPAAPYTLGNVSVLSTVRGCAYFDEDLGLDKQIPITESKRFAVGAFITNLFNRHQFQNLNTNIDAPNFGTFAGASFPRTVQLYVRLEF